MNEKFFALPEEKRMLILNAALYCFSHSDYKHAVTDDIAARAGISKGLLFHYFGNKRGLYDHLFQYSLNYLTGHIHERYSWEGDDLFEIMRRSSRVKAEIMREHPDLFRFLMNAYYHGSEEGGTILALYGGAVERSKRAILEKMDRRRLRPGTDPERLLETVLCCAEGFLLQAQRSGELYEDLDRLCDRFDAMLDELERAFYITI